MEIWAPTQTPGAAVELVAGCARHAEGEVTLHQTRVGGGFGRRLMNDYVCEAAAISKQAGVPVKLQWTREDDMQHDFYRVGGFHSFKGGVDDAGKLVAWQDHFITFSQDGQKPTSGGDLAPDEFPALLVPNVRLTQTKLPLAIPTGPWRAPRSNSIAFAVQSFLHECSVAAKRDHLEFLLEVMGEPRWLQQGNEFSLNTGRAAAVIKLAAEKAGWGKPLPKGRGLGLAFHFSHAGHFAEVAEVSVDANRKLTLHQVTVAGDIGPIVNMSGAENQVEGSVVDGFSTAMGLQLSYRERPHPGDELRSLPAAAHSARAGGRRALHPERVPADRRRRAGVAAGRAGDLQRDLRRNGPSGAHAAAEQRRVQGLSVAARRYAARSGGTRRRVPDGGRNGRRAR